MKAILSALNSVLLSFVLAGFILMNSAWNVSPDSTQAIDTFRLRMESGARTAFTELIRPGDDYIWYLLIAAVVVMLNVIAWIIPITRLLTGAGSSSDRITLVVNGGKVSLTISALEESLGRTLRGDPHIKDSRVMVKSSGNRIRVRAQLTLLETENLHTVEADILDRMRAHFERIFPTHQQVTYEVVINKLRPSVGGMSPSEKPSSVEQPLYPDHTNHQVH